jgi:hypothetical protein
LGLGVQNQHGEHSETPLKAGGMAQVVECLPSKHQALWYHSTQQYHQKQKQNFTLGFGVQTEQVKEEKH